MQTHYRKPLKLEDNEFYREHPKVFDMCQRFLEYTFPSSNSDTIKYTDLHVPMAYKLFQQGRSAFEAILFLCNRGYPVQSFSLCRELFEALVNILYLKKKPNLAERFHRYTEYQSLLHRRNLTRLPQDSIFFVFRELIGPWSEANEERLRQLESGFLPNKYRWCGLSVREMACEVGLEADYELAYGFLSSFAHQTDPSFFEAESDEPTTIKGRQVPSLKGIGDALSLSSHFFDLLFRCWLRIMGELDEQTEKEIAEIVQVLCCPNNRP